MTAAASGLNSDKAELTESCVRAADNNNTTTIFLRNTFDNIFVLADYRILNLGSLKKQKQKSRQYFKCVFFFLIL